GLPGRMSRSSRKSERGSKHSLRVSKRKAATGKTHTSRRGSSHGCPHITVERFLPRTNSIQTYDPERILAVDIRPQSLGFVVFEGARLLDWGVKRFPRGVNAVRIPPGPKLGALIVQYVPDAFVLKRPRRGSEKMLRETRAAANAHDVAVSILSAQAVKRAFLAHSNKDKRAAAI